MHSFIEEYPNYSSFKPFASFLLDNCLDECIKEYYSLLKKYNAPVLNHAENLPEDEKKISAGDSLIRFLEDIVNGQAIESTEKTVEKWKSDKLEIVNKNSISASDILIIFSVKKQVFLNHLERYTQSCSKLIEVIKEIEVFFLQLEQRILNTYVEIQKEIILEQKEFSESIFNNTIDGIFAWDHSYIITAWNAVLEKQFNILSKDIIGKSYFDVFPAYIDSKEAKAMESVLLGQRKHFPENPYLYKEGFYEMHLIPLKDVNGKISGGLTIVHDISARKKSETLILDHKKELQAANGELQKQQDELRKTHQEIIERKKNLEEINATLEKEILTRKTVEETLKKEQIFTQAILNNMREGIVACDQNSQLSFFNEASKKFHGAPYKQLDYKEWPTYFNLCLPDGETLLSPEETPLFKALNGEEVQDQEMVIAPKNQKKLFLSVNGQAILDDEGKKLGAVVVMHDITTRKQAEKEIFEKNNALLSALDKLKIAENHLLKLNSELELKVQRGADELSANEEELRQTLDQTIQLNEIITQREKFLSSIIDQTPISTSIFDSKGNQIRVNNACIKLFGAIDEKQGIGKYNILKDEVLLKTPYYDDIKEVFTKGKIAKFTTDYDLSEVNHVSIPTGKAVSVITTIFPIKDSSDNVINAIVQHEDITEKKRAEEALKSSEEQLRLITDALPVLIAYIDNEQKYRFNNRAYEDWFNISRDKIYGRTVREVVGETAYKKLHEPINKVLQGEEFYHEAYLPYDGAGQKYVAINYIPHFSNNEVSGYYTLINDISKQKEIQRALELALQNTNDKNEELQKINNDLDNFIYIASHDLKSPIVNLEGLVSSLNKRIAPKTNDAEKRVLEMIRQSIEKFKKTLKNLTEVTKAQRNLEEEKEVVDLRQIIQEVKDEIDPMITESNAVIKEDIEVVEMFFVPLNIRSIIYNLLTNAIKYRKSDVPLEIIIRSYRKGTNIVLSVKDNGLGLSESQQTKLFTMFKRMHSHVEGTGIGLYILKRIAENNGGKVEVESAVNVGTEFKVYFRDN